jgi:hypothetical protein
MDELDAKALLPRTDFLTSAALDHALSLQNACGTEHARRYLARCCIPWVVADRILSDFKHRREPMLQCA